MIQPANQEQQSELERVHEDSEPVRRQALKDYILAQTLSSFSGLSLDG